MLAIDTKLAQDRLHTLLSYKRNLVRARDSLIEFTKLIMPSADDELGSLYDPQDFHELIASELEMLASGKHKRLIIVAPPRHGKTQLTSKAFPTWLLGRDPSINIIVATYNEMFAKDLGRACKSILTSPRYRQAFPDVEIKVDNKSAVQQQTHQGGVIYSVGRGSAITGRGGNLIIVDDPLKDRKEADSKVLRETLWTWFTQVLSTRLMTGDGRMCIIQTRWHEDDLVGRLTDPGNPHYDAREAKKWRVLHLPGLAGKNDPLGRRQGTPLWPARFDKAHLKSIENQDRRGFSALYQGAPSPEEGSFFDVKNLMVYRSLKELPRLTQMRFYCVSDHAVSTEQDADKTCMIPFGVDPNDTIWILPEVWWQRADTQTAVGAMLWLMKRYKFLFWWAEKGHITKSIGPFLRRRMSEEQTFCAVHEVLPAGDKQTRAQSIHARVAMGRVRFPGFANWWPEARRELLTFPNGTYDDFVDAMSLIGLGLDMQAKGQKAKPKVDNVPKQGTLRWVKWQSDREKAAQRMRAASAGW